MGGKTFGHELVRRGLDMDRCQWIVLTLLLYFGAHGAGSDCLRGADLMNSTTVCLNPLSDPTEQALVGGLGRDSWKMVCATYNESRKCVERLVKDCPDGGIQVRETLTQALKTSMGQLCSSKSHFERYLLYAGCYARQSEATTTCMANYNEDVKTVLRNIQIEEPELELCRIHSQLITCIQSVIRPECGADAVRLIFGIVKAQLPVEISNSANCNSPAPPSSGQPRLLGHCKGALLLWSVVCMALSVARLVYRELL